MARFCMGATAGAKAHFATLRGREITLRHLIIGYEALYQKSWNTLVGALARDAGLSVDFSDGSLEISDVSLMDQKSSLHVAEISRSQG
jgi:hypothetical protein